jgi:membrane-associated protease RseP (regulator of RpoE activity)
MNIKSVLLASSAIIILIFSGVLGYYQLSSVAAPDSIQMLVSHWCWFVFLGLFLLGIVLIPRSARVQTMAGFIFKINSTRGLRTVDALGRRFKRFWINIGDIALILLFGGLGSAFVAHHASKKKRAFMAAAFAFLAVYVYVSFTTVSFVPFLLSIEFSLEALVAASIAAVLVYKLSPKLGKNGMTILIFILSAAFFASYFALLAYVTESWSLLILGVAMGVMGLPAFILVSLASNAFDIIAGVSTQPGLNLGLPTIEEGVPVLKYSGTNVSIPIFPDILVALFLMLVLHEGFHGLLARAQGIPLKNTGLLFASVLPLGAFVEPDEEKFAKERNDKKLRVYAVGSFANVFVVALAALLLANLMIATGAVQSQGMFIDAVAENTATQGIEPGDILESIDGVKMTNYADFYQFMTRTTPGQTVSITTNKASFDTVLVEHSSNSHIGFLGLTPAMDPIISTFMPSLSGAALPPDFLFNLLKWIFFLNFMLGLINLLPIKPFDGGYVYEGIFRWMENNSRLAKRVNAGKLFVQAFALFVLAIFIINILPYSF